MRRPAQHHLGPTPRTAWAHPYTGVLANVVFYNDGGQQGAPAPVVPSPADVAARAGQAAPAPVVPATPAVPQGAPRVTDDDRELLIDKHTGQPMTQGRFSQIMTKQHEKSRNSAFRQIAEAVGLDPETFDPAQFAEMFKEGESARQARLTEEERRVEELANREKALETREAEAVAREAAAAKRDRDSKIEQALVRLGATGDDLKDAVLLISVPEDANDQQITDAADALKQRREALFGGTPAPQTLPPAPSGGPAGGNAPRQPAGDKDAINAAARQMAIDRGLRRPDAA